MLDKFLMAKWLSTLKMNLATRVLILDETDYISYGSNSSRKGMNHIILLSAMGKKQGRLSSLILVSHLV